MWKKAALTIFVVGFLMFTFGVKQSFAQVSCCTSPYQYVVPSDECCTRSDCKPNNCGGFECIDANNNIFNRNWICNFSATAPPPMVTGVTVVPTSSPFDPCKNLGGDPADINSPVSKCRLCTGIEENGVFSGVCAEVPGAASLGASCGTWTSLGCIPNDPTNLVGYILRFGSGIAGGIAFLLILFGAGQIVMSGGVPEKIAAGKEVITSAVIGLVFIFVSVLVLQIIGVKIIGIPGWT